MYTRVLVPLDGSPASESVLPFALSIARGFGIRVHLMRVVESEVVAAASKLTTGHRVGPSELLTDAERYLQELSGRSGILPLPITEPIVIAEPAAAIVFEARKHTGTLLCMATHGRSGIGRFLLGSVAYKVLHTTATPLVLYREGQRPKGGTISAIVVPLDGSELAEEALPHAAAFADAMLAPMILTGATPLIGGLTPGYELTPGDVSVEIGKALESYLRRKAEEIGNDATKATAVHLLGQPVDKILETVKKRPGSMVVMTSHGRSGLGRMVLGSVTDGVVRHVGAPVLVVPAKGPPKRKKA